MWLWKKLRKNSSCIDFRFLLLLPLLCTSWEVLTAVQVKRIVCAKGVRHFASWKRAWCRPIQMLVASACLSKARRTQGWSYEKFELNWHFCESISIIVGIICSSRDSFTLHVVFLSRMTDNSENDTVVFLFPWYTLYPEGFLDVDCAFVLLFAPAEFCTWVGQSIPLWILSIGIFLCWDWLKTLALYA